MMPVSETDIYRAFLRLFNKLMEHHHQILQPIITDLEKLRAAKETDEHLAFVNQQITDLMRQHHALTRLRILKKLDEYKKQAKTQQAKQPTPRSCHSSVNSFRTWIACNRWLIHSRLYPFFT